VDTASCAEATGRHRDLFEEPEGGAKHFLEDPQCLATATRNAIAISTAISLTLPTRVVLDNARQDDKQRGAECN
jgi:hypothetical protein